MKEALKKVFESIPDGFIHDLMSSSPNDEITIVDSEATIEAAGIKLSGRTIIRFNWLPKTGISFEFDCGALDVGTTIQLAKSDSAILEVDSTKYEGLIFRVDQERILGVLHNFYQGDTSVKVERVDFLIPNMRELHGGAIKKSEGTRIKSTMGRFSWSWKKFTITIDKSFEFANTWNALTLTGGYGLLYSGFIRKQKGEGISVDECSDILILLQDFLSYLNGRRTSPLFPRGKFENHIVWTLYENKILDSYQNVDSWSSGLRNIEINQIFDLFAKTYQNREDKIFTKDLIHWYLEANNASFAEASIIMTQIGLELIYNYILVKKEPVLRGRDSEDLSASNKIRLICRWLKFEYYPFDGMPRTMEFLSESKDVNDVPELFTLVRNRLVHSSKVALEGTDMILLLELKNYGLHLIEVSMLRFLGYSGKYSSRVHKAQWLDESLKEVQ